MKTEAEFYLEKVENDPNFKWYSQNEVSSFQRKIERIKKSNEKLRYFSFYFTKDINEAYEVVMKLKIPAIENTEFYILSTNKIVTRKEEKE